MCVPSVSQGVLEVTSKLGVGYKLLVTINGAHFLQFCCGFSICIDYVFCFVLQGGKPH